MLPDIKLLNSQNGNFFGDFNDVEFKDGDLVLVSGHPRASQTLVKALLTQRGTDTLFPNYGSELNSFIGTNAFDPTLPSRIKDEIIRVVAYVKQSEESTDPSERLSSIDELELTLVTDQLGRNGFIAALVVSLEDGFKISLPLSISI